MMRAFASVVLACMLSGASAFTVATRGSTFTSTAVQRTAAATRAPAALPAAALYGKSEKLQRSELSMVAAPFRFNFGGSTSK
jgi:hypothetical protein